MQNLALVVEDDTVIRSFVKHVLRALNFDVLEAATEEAGWEVFNQNHSRINFVYSDIVLDQGDGISLYQRIRAISSNLVVVLASGYPNIDVDLPFDDEFSYYLPKPFRVERLMQIVKEIHTPVLRQTLQKIC